MLNSGVKVNELAVMLNVANVTIYRKMKKLKNELKPFVYKDKGVSFIMPEGVEMIKNAMNEDVSSAQKSDGCETLSPVKHVEQVNEILEKQLSEKQKVIDNLLGQLNEQRQRSDTIIMKLSNDLSNAVKAIEGSRTEIRMLETRINEVSQVQPMFGKKIEPEVIQSSWMRKVGDWLFDIIGPGATDRATTSTYYDFKYL